MKEGELNKEFNDFFGLEREQHFQVSNLECKNFARYMVKKERERCSDLCRSVESDTNNYVSHGAAICVAIILGREI